MNLETKITIYKFTPQLFTLTRKGVKSFKEGMNGVEDDIDGKDKKGETKE